jgi:hypothetical protein
MYPPAYCSILTGVATPASLRAGVLEEARCNMAAYVTAVHAVERTLNFTNFESGCQSAVTALIRSGRKFGPASAYERFVIVCRTCAKYGSLWTPLTVNTPCDCYSFGLNRCPHWNPTDMMCAATGVCANQTQYTQQFCDISACGSAAVDEASWRKCPANSGTSIFSSKNAVVAFAMTLLAALCVL